MSTHSDALEPIEPSDALELFIDKRRSNNRSPSTITSNRSHLGIFVDWLEAQGITNMNDLTGRDVFQYRQQREHEDGLAPASLKGQISTIRMFLQFCEEIEALPQDFHRKVDPVKLSVGDEISDVAIDGEEAEAIEQYLERFDTRRSVTSRLRCSGKPTCVPGHYTVSMSMMFAGTTALSGSVIDWRRGRR